MASETPVESGGRWGRRAAISLGATALVFVGGFALASLLADGGWQELELTTRVSWGLVLGLLGLSTANYLARAIRWHLFSLRMGVRLPFLRHSLYFVSGFALTTTPGKAGEALRLWLLNRGHRYRYSQTLPILVGDRLSDASALFVLSLVGAASFSRFLPATVLAGVLVAGVTVFLMRPTALRWLVGRAYRVVGRRPRLFAAVRSTLSQTRKLGSWRLYSGTLVLAGAGWLAEASAFYWLLDSLDAPVSYPEAIFIFSFSVLVGALAMLPGGLGGTEATMVALLTASGTGIEVSLAATGIIRITTLWFAVGLGILALPIAVRRSRPAPRQVAA